MEYTKQGHCVYYAKYHLVFVTKYRRKILIPGIMDYLKQVLNQIRRYYPDVRIEDVNGDQEHLHLFMSIPPKMSVSKVVNIIKSNTASKIRKNFKFLDKVFWGDTGIWSNGYFVSTTGINEQIIKRYIELQGKEDNGQAKLEFS